jgi:hypothetical protein
MIIHLPLPPTPLNLNGVPLFACCPIHTVHCTNNVPVFHVSIRMRMYACVYERTCAVLWKVFQEADPPVSDPRSSGLRWFVFPIINRSSRSKGCPRENLGIYTSCFVFFYHAKNLTRVSCSDDSPNVLDSRYDEVGRTRPPDMRPCPSSHIRSRELHWGDIRIRIWSSCYPIVPCEDVAAWSASA